MAVSFAHYRNSIAVATKRWMTAIVTITAKLLDHTVKIGKNHIRFGYIVIAIVSAFLTIILTTTAIHAWQTYSIRKDNPTKEEVQQSLQALLE